MPKELIKAVTPEARLVFPHLFEPYAGVEGSEEKYSAVLVFPKGTDLSGIHSVVAKAAASLKSKSGARNPLCDGNEKADEWGDVFQDAKYIRVSSKFQPKVVDSTINDIIDQSKVYSGCYCRAAIHAYPYEKAGNRGVSLGLDAIQITRDGEPLGGSRAAVKLFDDGFVAPASSEAEDDPFK